MPLALAALSLHAVGGKVLPLDSKHAAAAFNADYTGHGSAPGVFMRQSADWEIWCGSPCYKGRPDCTMSASFWNLHIGVDRDLHFVASFDEAAKAGVVFNSTLVERELARCYYSTDGMTQFRYNGGCACETRGKKSCSSPDSPYSNIGPDGKWVNGDSAQASECMCRNASNIRELFGLPCFWRAPAYNTSGGPYGSSELREMIQQRMLFESFSYGVTFGTTEVVIDSRRLENILATDPASAVAAVFFYPGKRSDLDAAERIQRTFAERYGVSIPIVGVNGSAVVSASQGPFFEYGPAAPAAFVV